MPLFDDKPAAPQPPKAPSANITPPRFQGVKVDSKMPPLVSFQPYVAGHTWRLQKYWSQYIGPSGQPMMYSINVPAPDQQYQCINNMEVKVIDPLSPSYQDNDAEFSLRGSAVTYNGIVPNYGDAFVADRGDGLAGLFVVTSAKPDGDLSGTTYHIEYGILSIYDEDHQRDLQLKTQDEVQFVRELYLNGQRPLLIANEFEEYRIMVDLLRRLPLEYHREFFNNDYATYLIPNQERTAYDGFVINFFKSVIDSRQHPWIRNVKVYNTDQGFERELFTLFDAALQADENIIDHCEAYIGLYPAGEFIQQGLFSTIRFSGIEKVAYPPGLEKGRLGTVRSDLIVDPIRQGVHVALNSKIDLAVAFSTVRASGFEGGIPHKPWVNDRPVNPPYVFSEAFYTNSPEQSAVELMYREAIRGTFQYNEAIIKLCGDRRLWTNTTRFYYLPIVLYILRTAIGNFK